MNTATATASAAKAASETVVEFVLHRREGGDKLPVMSDHDLDVVKMAKTNTIAQALAHGQARPDLVITQRTCTYPVRGGKRQAEGSTCDEKEL